MALPTLLRDRSMPGLAPMPSLRLLFVVLAALAVPLAILRALGWSEPMQSIVNWVFVDASDDSWFPIAAAVRYATTHATAAGLYQATYFNAAHQFIYPPTAVTLFLMLKTVFRLDAGATFQMNLLSWAVIPALAAVHYGILRQVLASNGEDAAHEGRSRATCRILAGLSVLLYFPIMYGYAIGQIQTWLTLLLASALLLWLKDRKLLAGVLIGLVVVIKPPMGVLALFALLRGEGRLFLGMAATGGLLLAGSVALLGWQVHVDYLGLLGYLSQRGESYHGSQSVESMLYRLIHVGNNLTWDGAHTSLPPVGWVHLTGTLTAAVTLGLALLWPRPRTARESAIDLALVMLSVILSSPVAYDHHFGIASAIFLLLAAIALTDRRFGAGCLAALALGYALTAHWIPMVDYLADTDWNILQSHLLMGVLLILGTAHVMRWRLRRRPGSQDDTHLARL